MLDPETFARVIQAQEDAKRLGLSLAEVLDRRGLLLTPKREHALQVRVLDDLLRRLDRQSANKVMTYYHGRVDGTPAEMFTAMYSWVEAVARNLANKTLEDL